MKVTPELAQEWLADKWEEQRKLRDPHMQRLCNDMNSGNFKLGPDAILRIKGKLANGQHRLTAVVMTGKPQLFLVMTSNDPELYKVVDAGMKRTVADAIQTLPYNNHLPAIARWVQSYQYGYSTTASTGADCIKLRRQSQLETINYVMENSELLIEAASFAGTLYEKTKLLQGSIGGAVYAICSISGRDMTVCKSFLEKVYTSGSNDAAGDLHNRLVSNKTMRAKLASGYIFAITLKALKAYFDGTRPGHLKIGKDEELTKI